MQDLLLWRTLKESRCQIICEAKSRLSLIAVRGEKQLSHCFSLDEWHLFKMLQKVCIDSFDFLCPEWHLYYHIWHFDPRKCHHAAVNCVVAQLFWLG